MRNIYNWHFVLLLSEKYARAQLEDRSVYDVKNVNVTLNEMKHV